MPSVGDDSSRTTYRSVSVHAGDRRVQTNSAASPSAVSPAHSEVCVGRHEELALLNDAWRRAAAGTPQLVWIEAGAGMGKTTLLHHAGLLDGSAHSARTVVARADATEISLRWGVATQLLAGAARLASRPSSLDRPERSTPPPGADPVAVGAEILAVVDDLQREPPAVLVVEDIHLCDPPSAQALLFALRRMQATEQLLVVLTARPGAIEQLGESWRRLRDDARTTTIVLGGLDAAHVVELAQALGIEGLPTPVADRLVEHTGGHPLYARSVLEDVPLAVLARPSVTLPVPRSLGSVFLARLDQLPNPAKALVVASAVVGRPLPLAILGTVAHDDRPSTGHAPEVDAASHHHLDEALASGLLTTHPGGMVGCRHVLVQAAVVGDLPTAQLAALHRRAAAVLDGTERLVHLVAALDAPDPVLAGQLRDEAARRRRAGAYDEAADLLLLAASASDPSAAASATLDAAEALIAGGDRSRAASLSEQIAAATPSARRDYLLGCCAFIHGRSEEARRYLLAALSEASSDPAAGAMAATTLALADLGRGDVKSVVALGRRAVELAGSDPERSASATTVLAMGLAIANQHHEAKALLQQWVAAHAAHESPQPARSDPVAPSQGNPPEETSDLELTVPLHTPGVLDLLVTLGIVELAAGQARQAASTLRQASAAMRLGAPGTLGVQALSYLADAELRLGRWDDAQVHAELAVSVAHDTETVWSYAAAHAVAARVHAWRGDATAAVHHEQQAQDAARRYPSWSATAWAGAATATTRLLAGDPVAAADALEPVFDPPTRRCVEGIGAEPWLALLADAQLAAGSLDAAAATLDQLATKIADRHQHQLHADHAELDLHRLRALLADRRGDHTTAAAIVDYGLERLSQVTDASLAAARLELSSGKLLRRWKRRGDAVTLLQRARVRLEQLGCAVLLDEADAELRRCGVLTHRARPSVDLTPQEQAVAYLAAGGHTNRDIARELFVSVKAVEYHLGNVYAKLGIRARRQLRSVLDPTLEPTT